MRSGGGARCNSVRRWWLGRSSSTSNWGCRSARWGPCCDSATASRSAVADWSVPSTGPAGTRGRPMRVWSTKSATVPSSRPTKPAGRSAVGSTWLRVVATPRTTVYQIQPGRGYPEAANLLGTDFACVIIRDGWAPYRRFTGATHESGLTRKVGGGNRSRWGAHTQQILASLSRAATRRRGDPQTVIADLLRTPPSPPSHLTCKARHHRIHTPGDQIRTSGWRRRRSAAHGCRGGCPAA